MNFVGNLRKSAIATATLFAISLVASTASAQDGTFELQQLNPAPSQTTGYFNLSSARGLRGGQYEVGLLLNYADDPLVLYAEDGDGDLGDRARSIVSGQLLANIHGGIGLLPVDDNEWARLEIGVDIPIIIFQDGDAPVEGLGLPDATDAGFGVGDIRLVPKLTFLNTAVRNENSGIALGLLVDLLFPAGRDENYQGDGEFRIEPRLLFDYLHRNSHSVGVNVGYQVRNAEEQENVEIGHLLTYGLAARIEAFDKAGDDSASRLYIVPEIVGEVTVGTDDFAREETPLEALLGLKYFFNPDVMLQAGAGMGLVRGVGTPDWRVFLGAAFSPVPDINDDYDGDGILNVDDECPYDREDFDGFEDVEGCPDRDNDNDGILDMTPEDDFYSDFGPDACPMVPEDRDGDEDEDGCPEDDGDADGDGILDSDDECPNDPEDRDQFEDTDGCPDIDNDQDGILDVEDACPNQPEDMDGWEDEDGCPDIDNDSDGILDVDDACPDEAEIFNAFEDTDGCPDEGVISLTCEGVAIDDRVYFATDSARIRDRSNDLLNNVAQVIVDALVRFPNLRLRVEGHTDSRGSDEYNLDLSDRRAASVRTYLIDRGVPPSALESQGFGERRPIDSNDNSEGRQNNRRVEFNAIEDPCPDGQQCIDGLCRDVR